MFVSLVIAGALASLAPPPPSHNPSVSQVLCVEGKGTAFRISPDTLLSVTHVTQNTACRTNGESLRVTYDGDGTEDFSILHSTATKAGPSSYLKVSCEGFRDGRRYWAIGYARGASFQTILELRGSAAATAWYGDGKYAVLLGYPTVIPGMSGGPIVDEKGRVVGVVNAYRSDLSLSFSRQLRDTPICKK